MPVSSQCYSTGDQEEAVQCLCPLSATLLGTKRKLSNACVLSVLLYGAECWIPFRKHTRKLNTFHHRCVSIKQQWSERITVAGDGGMRRRQLGR